VRFSSILFLEGFWSAAVLNFVLIKIVGGLGNYRLAFGEAGKPPDGFWASENLPIFETGTDSVLSFPRFDLSFVKF
jgi:hypothetical protein